MKHLAVVFEVKAGNEESCEQVAAGVQSCMARGPHIETSYMPVKNEDI